MSPPPGERHGKDAGRGLLLRALTPRLRLLIAAGLVAAALAVALGAVFGGAAGERVGARLSPLSAPARAPAPAAPPAGFTRFSAPGLFSIDYPSDWRRLGSRGADVDLLATRGEAASLLVRTIALRVPIERRDLAKVRTLTDEVVASGRQVRLLAEARRIELGGLPGYFYFYSFSDPRSGRRGTHSHYFLFRGDKMITIVLQALPERRFERFSEDFDRIAASFRAVSR